MKKILSVLFLIIAAISGFAQIDKEQLALTISKADDANTEKLKAFVWKRKSDVSIGVNISFPPLLNLVLTSRENFRPKW